MYFSTFAPFYFFIFSKGETSLVESVDDFGIQRRKKGNAEKYKKRAFQCKLCKWGHSNKASEKVKEHVNECPARWIFEKWQPKPLEDLKFVKS